MSSSSKKAGPRNCNGSNSNSSSSTSSNHMPAQRGNASSKISESSSSLGTTTATTTSTSSSSSVKHVVADKSAVKRKKRRKDDDNDGEDEGAAIITERMPIVLLTRLEDERKANESRVIKHVSDVKVVIERTDNIESIRAASSDKSVGKKSTRHSVHRSSENLASSNAKTLETISEKEERLKSPSRKEADNKVVEEKVKAPTKKEEDKKVLKEKIKAPPRKEEEKVKALTKKEKKVVEEKVKASLKKDEEKVKAPAKKEQKMVEECIKAPSKKEEEKVKAPAKKEKKVVEETTKATSKKEEEKAPVKKEKKLVEETTKAPSKKEEEKAPVKKEKKVVEETSKAPSKKEEEKAPAKKEKKVVDETIKAPAKKEEEKALAKKEKKVVEETIKAPSRKEEGNKVVEKVNAPSKKKEEKKVVEEKTKAPSEKEEEEKKVVEEKVKAPPKKSIESTKNSDQTESRNRKVKSDQKKPPDDSAEPNVHNVNNDNLKRIDPKISERQLSVRLDRSQVESYLEKQRLQRLQQPIEDKTITETEKYHSGSETQEDNVLSKEIKTCAIPSDNTAVAEKVQNDSLEKASVDGNEVTDKIEKEVTDKVEEVIQENVEKPAEIKVKKSRGRPCKNKEETAESVVKNQRLPSKEKKKRAKSKDVVANESNEQDGDKDLGGDTKTCEDSSVQVSENQIESLDENPKDTSCKFAKSDKVLSCPSSESLNESAVVVHSEQESSKIFETERLNDKIVETNSSSDNAITNIDSSTVPKAEEPAQLPMEVNAIPQDCTGVDDSKAEDDSAQQICDIHSKSAEEDAETVAESTETILSESTESLVKNHSVDSLSSESPIKNLISSDSTECPAKATLEESKTSELLSKNLLASETSESVANGEVVASPADSFVTCENVESTHEDSITGENVDSLIETIEDTESTASTCTLIEETPEELSQEIDKELDAQDELPEDDERLPEEVDRLPEVVESQPEAVESQPKVDDVDEVHKEIKSIKELPQVAEKEEESQTPEDASLKPDKNFSQEDKIVECPELQESTFENDFKSVENLVIDSILNGEIVSPKITLQSAASRVEDQSFVFESSVEDFVNDIVAKEAPVNLEPTNPVNEIPTSVENNFVSSAAMVEAEEVSQDVVTETLQPAVPIEETPSSEATLPLESLPSVVDELAIEEASKTLETPPPIITEKEAATTPTKDTSFKLLTPNEEPTDEEFAKHRRKHTLSELKKKCTENIDKRNAQQASLERETSELQANHQQQPLPQANSVNETTHSDDSDLQVPSSVLSSDCYHHSEPTTIGNGNYFENVSDAESEICLAERLSRLTGLDIPSLEEEPLSSLADKSEGEESTPERTKRQRILMKITKTDANEHVTHLVEEEAKEEEETPMLQSSDQQLIAAAVEQVTEGEIKIIMRKESSSNNHVIKEIKIIPRTPEGNNSARIPGYSPTSSDLSSGNSSCRVPSCSPAKPDSGSYRMPGWSPASTEMGQSTTIKKKQGRPKKYPIFTDAELIAKTTAIVNNSEVHTANQLTADKPLFEPVESIRINEEDEVEDHEEEEEHQTMITEQTCLSGSQLLEAMPAQPEILAKLAQQIEEGQEQAKRKRKGGRPRKHPRPGDVIDEGTKLIVSENVTVERVAFNVVDSIEEFVEPIKQIPSVMPVSPAKKPRGRPRKVQVQESGVEESDSMVEDATGDKKTRMSRRLSQDGENSSMTEDNTVVAPPKIERRGRKPWKHLKNLDKSAENQTIDGADSQTEDETLGDAVVTKKVERRGRKPWKHLKNLESLSADSADSQTEDESTVGDDAVAKPKVERRGRKPWKHLKNLENQSADGGDSQTEDEAPVGDDAVEKPKVERKGRKPWKHLKNISNLSENQVAEDADSQTEDETVDDAAVTKKVERRGRKPWKHLKNINQQPSENLTTEGIDSQTEDETVDDASAPAPRVERKGRKPWKHLKNVDKSIESQATEDADSQTEDETFDEASAPAPRVERRGRKPWKHLKNLEKTAESQAAEDADSQTEDETVGDDSAPAPRVERRGRKPCKHLKNVDKSAENQTTEGVDSQTEDETVDDAAVSKPKIERRGRKPWKHLKNIEKAAENLTPDGADSQTEDETPPVGDVSAPVSKIKAAKDVDSQTEGETVDGAAVTKKVERRGRKPWKHLKNIEKAAENRTADGADSQTEDESSPVDNASAPTSESKVAENADSQKENETIDTAPVTKKVERRGRKPWKHLKNISQQSSENQNTEGVDSQTEDETVDDASVPPVRVEKRGRKPWKHLKKVENQSADGADSQTEDETVDDAAVTKKVERRGRKPWKHLKNLEKPSENQVTEEIVDNTLENYMTEEESADDTTEAAKSTNAEEANSMTENESADDTLAVKPKVERRGRKPWKHLKNLDKSTDSQFTENADSQTEDETSVDAVVVTKKVENRGRKPWKHLKNSSQSSENQVAQEQDSMTEGTITNDDSVAESKVEKRGRPRKKKVKNILKMILPQEKRKRGRPRREDYAFFVRQSTENKKSKNASALLEKSAADKSSLRTEDEASATNDLAVEFANKESSSNVSTPSEETTSNTENDAPAVEDIVKKKRGRKSLKNLQDISIFEDNNLAAAELNSMTEDESVNDALATGDEAAPVVEKKKKGRSRKLSQDDSTLPAEVSSVSEDNTANDTNPTDEQVTKSAVTEDETVSSTEDIPTKNPSPMKSQKAEESSSLTEDETVSSTEDITTSDPQQQQQQQPVVKKGRPRKIVQTDSSTTPAASSVEESTTMMEPPVIVKRRGRQPFKKPDSTLPDNNTSAYTTEDETVSSTEDIPTFGEQQQSVVKKDGRGRSRKNVPEVEMSDSLAASSVEDLSAVEASPKKKPGRKPKVRPVQDSETAMSTEGESSMTASSMEDLSLAALALELKKKRGKKAKTQLQDDSACSESMEELMRPQVHVKKRGRPFKYPRIPIRLVSADMSADSIEEFSPVKQLSPVKLKKQPQDDAVTPKVLEQVAATLYQDTFAKEQPTYDKLATSLSPVKRRGRPPKFPRKEIISDELSAAEQQQPVLLEKRKAKLPRRLSQDENILPSHIESRPGRSPRRMSHEEEDAPVLGKRQGRPPRKFSPAEEHSFSALPQTESDSPTSIAKRPGRSPKKYSHDEGVPAVSDSDELSSGSGKRKGRPPKKFAIEDGFTSGGESLSPTKRKGRLPKSVLNEESPPIPQPSIVVSEKTPVQNVSLPIVPPLPVASSNENTGTKKISTTNLLRQQRKPKMAQPQQQPVESTSVSVAPPTAVVEKVQQPEYPPPLVPIKKGRGRPSTKLQAGELPSGLTLEQLKRRRHSQDDSMFTEELPKILTQRPKEFEDVQSKKKRGRPPKMRELSRHFVLSPVKPKTLNEAIAQAISPTNNLVLQERQYQKLGRPRKLSFEKTVPVQQPERPSRLTAADYLRTWTDRDESPTTQSANNKKHTRRRRFSQDDSVLPENFVLEASRPSSRNRLRRYSQGDALDDSSNDGLLNSRKRLRSSGSDSSLTQDEKRPRVEKELCDQHSITKELVVQLTKIDKSEEQSPTPPEPIREFLKMSLRRKIEGNNSVDPPPLVPIEPHRLQPPTHSDAKLLMLMQPSEEKGLIHQTVNQQQQPHAPPAPMQTQQFCIIFIPDSLTANDPNLAKDAQPTATIVNFQPVPDAEMTNKSVIYTPTTPTKIFVNSEEQHNRSFLCQPCTQALDMIQRMEANVGMTEEDKCAIRCPYCSENFQSLFHFEYHIRQEHLKCENEKQCRHSGFNTLRIPSQDGSHESAIYITFALKCRSCYELFENVQKLNDHVKQKHANLIRHKPPVAQFSTQTGMVCYPPPPPFKNGARAEVLHCPSDCICRIGIRSTDSPQQRANVLKRCPNFMRRMEKIEAAAYEVYTCAVCKSTFLMKDEVVEHLMKMHEVACKFPCTKCLASFRTVQLQENHQCSETTIRDLDKLINIVIMPTDKAHDNSKFEDSSNDEMGPIKTTPPPAVPSASTPLNGVKRKNGVVIQKLSRYLTMQPPKKPKLDATSTPLSGKKRQKTPCPKCQKKFAYRKSLNDHIIFEHIIPCRADDASKNMAVELLRLVNNGSTDVTKIQELADALGKHTDDDGVSLRKLTMIDDEQENWNDQLVDNDRDLLQCMKCKACFKLSTANLSRRNNQHPIEAPGPALCERCDPTKRRRNMVNNGHSFNNIKSATSNGEPGSPQRVQYLFECDRCGDTFPTTIELSRHKTEEHSKPGDPLKCEICAKVFYSPRMLEKHKKIHHDESMSNSRLEDDENLECNNQSVCNVSKDGSEANDTMNSSTSRRDSSDNKEEEKCKCPHCEYVAEKVSLKNHLKREHGVMAFICQFCGKLLVDISEVRHMLDYHIKSSNRKNNGCSSNGNVIAASSGVARDQDDVFDLLKTLGKKRLQSLMIYHDFEGKCNNAIMRCPICPEQFATRESCRHHYQWMHDSTCILCDTTYEGGNVAGKHKVAVHNSIASYVWAIQRLVSAIVHGLRLDRAQPSNVLYTEVSMRLDSMIDEETNAMMMNVDGELPVSRTSNKSGNEESVSEPFLEPVVLSEDQLPGSGNMIEVVIGNDVMVEDSEDNLLENFYLSPNYESSCEQPKILDAGAPIPELEEEEEVVATIAQTPMATTACATLAIPTTPSLTTSNGGILIPTTPVTADTYATSAVFKLRQDNGQEEVVLAITDEDLVTYRDDIGSLAERLSATCDSLSLEEITTMLRSYFENVGMPQEVDLANASVEPRTQ